MLPQGWLFSLDSLFSQISNMLKLTFISSDRSSDSDDVLLYKDIYIRSPLFQIFAQSIDANDVTSVTLSHLNSINAIDVTRC